MLKLAGYMNILTTASKKHHVYLSKLSAAHNFNYNSPTSAEDILKAAGGRIPLVVNNTATLSTLTAISQFIAPGSKLAVLLPVKDSEGLFGGDF